MKAILRVESRAITFEGFFTYAEIFRLGNQYAKDFGCGFEIEELQPFPKTTEYPSLSFAKLKGGNKK